MVFAVFGSQHAQGEATTDTPRLASSRFRLARLRAFIHQHRRLRAGSRPRVCVLGLSNTRQPLPRDRDQQAHRESRHYALPADKEIWSNFQQQTHQAHYSPGVRGLRTEHPTHTSALAANHGLCGRSKKQDSTPSTCALSEASPGETKHPSTQYFRGKGLPPCIPYTQAEASPLTWLCLPDGGQPYLQELSLQELRFKDSCKRDLKALAINTDTWEALACDRCAWRQEVQKSLSSNEDTLMQQPTESLNPRQTGNLDILLCTV